MDVPIQGELLQGLVRACDRVADGLVRVAEEMHRSNLVQMHRLFAEQLDRSIEEPPLAVALSTLSGISEGKRQQMLFANKQYGLILLSYRIGATDRRELLAALKILSWNPIFAEYWERTAEHRGVLPAESLEARVGRAVDAIMDERLDELDEWWVVGLGSEPSPG
ncbi:DUF6082 family protein [Streptomyces chartreusis]|uniref:DUF6082 family protein n=1 Tax=Streptomyces chartreusis TaxID=1969 RepID=UPI00368F6839